MHDTLFDEPAMPIITREGGVTNSGISRLEYFTAKAMAAYIEGYIAASGNFPTDKYMNTIADHSKKIARLTLGNL